MDLEVWTKTVLMMHTLADVMVIGFGFGVLYIGIKALGELKLITFLLKELNKE